ncbi:uncharacterized protein LOC132051498 isoform X1 [Lycium ferocissimum]|uniref:uncharacterized protein LOC132051498 isoform X1 n=1 Tax=Lycium ferocissimum TaxID=112874 RepID=UPI002814E209|nr:uncharacterized protein LOC132051498 isoform X1 [Lycium ferocissimum]XP_059298586.1 uncharacterized protein LOC132051498 isoform X1 [Lycium ferocissimum]XP_059298587.1 uncharacterized protein LOC132051498 isoform X1 [Lycium ferocissimum]XP_059298588.1 uncharacterized protein LOC132051498 isoform X1 [Lycium ferocissimum]
MEEKGKENSTADMRNLNKHCMDIEVIPKLEMLVDGQLCCADEELIIHYLYKKMIGQPFPNQTIHEVDFFLYRPQQLSQMHLPSQAEEWYFLSPANKDGQSNSMNSGGYWESCGTDSLIHKDGELIGYRKTLIYIEEKHEEDRSRTEWLVHEYRLNSTGTTSDDMQWVVCKLYKVSNKLIAAEEKEAAKSASPNDGVSSKGLTIEVREKASYTVNDEGPSNVGDDLHPLLDTSQVTAATLYSSSILLDQLIAAEEKEAPKSAGQNDGISSKGLTIEVPQRASNIDNDEGTSNVLGEDLHPLLDTDQVTTAMLHSSSMLLDQIWSFDKPHTYPWRQHDQGTVLPTPKTQHVERNTLTPPTGPHKATNEVVGNKRPIGMRNSQSPPASDEGFMIRNAKSQRLCDVGTMLPPPLPENDQRTIVPTKASSDVVTDTVPSNSQGSEKPECSEKNLDGRTGIFSFDGEWPLYPDLTELPPYDESFESLTAEVLTFFNQPDPEYP